MRHQFGNFVRLAHREPGDLLGGATGSEDAAHLRALCHADAEVVMTERVGSHGDAFWQEELPLMVAWAFG
jgi:hypothetical protein